MGLSEPRSSFRAIVLVLCPVNGNRPIWPGALVRRMLGSPLASALSLAVLIACAYVVAYPLLVVRYPPITDLPFHGAYTSVFRHYFDPSFHFREQFAFQLLKVPYWTQFVLGALLGLVMPIVTATKVAAALMLGLLPAGLAVLFRGMRKSPLLAVLALPLVWNTLTHWGFISFMAAAGLFAMTVGVTLLVLERPSRARQIALALVLLAVYATHIFRFPFAIAAVIGTTLVMWPASRRIKPVLLPLLPALLMFGLWLLMRDKPVTAAGVGPVHLHLDRLSMAEGFLFNGFVGPEELKGVRLQYWIVPAVALVAVLGLLVERRWRGCRARDVWWAIGSHLAVLCCALVSLGMYLTLPMEIGTWWYVFPREIVIAVFLAMGLLPDLPRPSWARLPLLVALGWGSIGQAFFVAKSYASFDAATEDFDRIIQQIPKAPKLGYMVFDHAGSNRTTTPFLHLPAWVQAMRGGWLSFHFVGWGDNPLRYREGSPAVPPPTPLRFEWTPERFEVETRGRFFDWFLVRSPNSPESRFRADPSIKLVDHQGRWWLLHRDAPSAAAPR